MLLYYANINKLLNHQAGFLRWGSISVQNFGYTAYCTTLRIRQNVCVDTERGTRVCVAELGLGHWNGRTLLDEKRCMRMPESVQA